jgi:serine protease Do
MSIAKISAATRNSYNVPEDVDGVIISEITARGEADEKGLALGDVIVEINQQGVTEPKDFNDIINKAIKDKKSSVLLLVNRAGDVRFVALKLDSE